MKLNLSLQAHTLIKHTLTFTGESEVNGKGEDVLASRKLNGEESSQRRHYFKTINPTIDEKQKVLQETVKEFNEKITKISEKLKLKTPQGKEKDEVYEAKINRQVNAEPKVKEWMEELNKLVEKNNEEMLEVELTDKTVEVVKKYFKEYDENVGWNVGDDKLVEEIQAKLC